MKITDPGARASVVVALVLLVPSCAALTSLVLAAAMGPALVVAPIGNAVLFLLTLGSVAFCARAFRGVGESAARPPWRLTEGALAGIVGLMSFLLLAVLWSAAHAGSADSIRLSGVIVFGVLAVAFGASTIGILRRAATTSARQDSTSRPRSAASSPSVRPFAAR